MLGVGDVIAIATLAVQVSTLCKEYVTSTRNASREVHDFIDRLERLSVVASCLKELIERNPTTLSTSQRLLSSLETCLINLNHVQKKLAQKLPTDGPSLSRDSGWKSLKWPFSKSAMGEKIVQLDKHLKDFELPLQVDQLSVLLKTHVHVEDNFASSIRIENKLDQSRQRELLRLLKHIPSAAFNAKERMHEPSCLSGTRADLLRDIEAWSEDLNSEPIFWLSGMAGTGKSTIAQTLAATFHRQKRLAGSFFFRRGQADLDRVDSVFSTLAFHMAQPQFPHFRELICDTIEQNETICERSMTEQYEILFAGILRQAGAHWPCDRPFVIIFDALDECEDEKGLYLLLKQLEMTNDLSTFKMKIFMTSRPEQVVHAGMMLMQDSTLSDFRLHDIDKTLVTSDISRYLHNEFVGIRQKHNLDESWPGDEVITALSVKADGLFIYAATICRFLHGCPRRKKVKDLVLKICDQDVIEPTSTKQLDAMYMLVLDQCNRKLEAFIDEDGELDLKVILIYIATTFDPITPEALSYLVYGDGKDPQDTIYEVLELLSSVLRFSKGQPLQVLHESFREFLIDQSRCQDPRLCVDIRSAHVSMAEACVRAMKDLKRDICGVAFVGTQVGDVSADTLKTSIPSHVAYACRYWLDHGVLGGLPSDLLHIIQDFLHRQALVWLETLAWLSDVSKAIEGLRQVEAKLLGYVASGSTYQLVTAVHRWITDLAKFTTEYVLPVSDHPLQIYCSALCFAPSSSLIANHFKIERPKWLSRSLTDNFREPHWDDSRCKFYRPSASPLEKILVSDSKFIVLVGNNDLKLFSLSSGRFMRDVLQGLSWKPQDRDLLVSDLSPDASLIAVGLPDGKVVLENIYNGHVLFQATESTQPISHMKFDSSSRYLTVVHYSGKAYRLTMSKTSYPIDTIRSETLASNVPNRRYHLPIHPSDISPDGSLLALQNSDTTVSIWDIKLLQMVRNIDFSNSAPSILKFSGNSAKLVLLDSSSRFRLWDRSSDQISSLFQADSHSVRPFSTGLSVSSTGKWICYPVYGGFVIGSSTTKMRNVLRSTQVQAAHFSSQEDILITMTALGTLELYDCASEKQTTFPFRIYVRQVYYSAAFDILAVAFGRSSECQIWDSKSFIQAAAHFKPPFVLRNYFLPSKISFVNTWSDGSLRLWTFHHDSDELTDHKLIMSDWNHDAVIISPLDNYMAMIMHKDDSNELNIISLDKEKMKSSLERYTGTNRSNLTYESAFSPTEIFAYNWGNRITVWNRGSHDRQELITGPPSWYYSNLVFMPDGTALAYLVDKTVHLWDLVSGHVKSIDVGAHIPPPTFDNLRSNKRERIRLRCSPNGQYLVLNTDQACCIVVDVKIGKVKFMPIQGLLESSAPGYMEGASSVNAWFTSQSDQLWTEQRQSSVSKILKLWNMDSEQLSLTAIIDTWADSMKIGDWYDLKDDTFRFPVDGMANDINAHFEENTALELVLRDLVLQKFQQSTITISQDLKWICMDSKKCLYLPVTRRPSSFFNRDFASTKGFISIVGDGGLLTILKMNPEQQPWLLEPSNDRMICD